MSVDLPFLSIAELSGLLARRQISPVEIVTALLDRIGRYNSLLHSYITVCDDQALAEARRAEREISRDGVRSPLHGIPVSFKDNIWTRGVRTTAHSRALQDFVPNEDATHVARLTTAGAILLGKTNTTEFATGGIGGFALFGTATNPWSPSHYAGGSSAGSANGLAAGLAVAATGSDTGGSIRIPASFCGVVGLKPTFGRVSGYGLIPLSWSMDNVGPLGRTVRDCALLLNVMAGHDPRDSQSARAPVPDFTKDLESGIKGLVLGLPRQHYYENLEPDVDAAMRGALRQLEGLGARFEHVDLPHAGGLAAVGNVLVQVEAFGQNAEHLRAHGPALGARYRRRVAGGAFYTAADYQLAMHLRQEWTREVDAAIQGVDALVTPTVPFPAFSVSLPPENEPDTSWGTRQFNLSGHPALSVPCGFTGAGLPIGMQLIAKAFEETTLFRLAHAYEQSTSWHTRRPALEEVAPYADKPRVAPR